MHKIIGIFLGLYSAILVISLFSYLPSLDPEARVAPQKVGQTIQKLSFESLLVARD